MVEMASPRGIQIFLLMLLMNELTFADYSACASVQTCGSSDSNDLGNTVSYLRSYIRQLLAGVDPVSLPKDCSDIQRSGQRQNGYYEIQPEGFCYPFSVYCIFEEDGCAWTLIQRRINAYISFDRPWDEYRNGFGVPGPNSNFWLGLEKLHHLTTQREYLVRFEITNWDGEKRHADYSMFYIENEDSSYSLIYNEFVGGTLRDSLLNNHRGMKFSTRDQDHDNAGHNCATNYGGWWFNACFSVNLNGEYRLEGAHNDTYQGIQWHRWVNKYSFKESAMKIKLA